MGTKSPHASIHSRRYQFVALGLPRLAMFALYEIQQNLSGGDVRTLVLALWFVMCEQPFMQKPTFKTLVDEVGISRGHASDILNNRRPPSRPLAIHIYRQTGWMHETIAGLTADQIAVLEQVDPWQPRQGAAYVERFERIERELAAIRRETA